MNKREGRYDQNELVNNILDPIHRPKHKLYPLLIEHLRINLIGEVKVSLNL